MRGKGGPERQELWQGPTAAQGDMCEGVRDRHHEVGALLRCSQRPCSCWIPEAAPSWCSLWQAAGVRPPTRPCTRHAPTTAGWAAPTQGRPGPNIYPGGTRVHTGAADQRAPASPGRVGTLTLGHPNGVAPRRQGWRVGPLLLWQGDV